MGTVSNVKLAITLDGSDFSPVTVTYTVGFSTTDIKNNDAYIADVTLWGEDGGLKGADDYLTR